ncbi:MAG: acyl-CoA dehydrogenase family protein [Chloroflexi bacterium]|nr:acyl-CoA dehydrogenase family protein [Chloroflexota bacterium]
MTELAARADTSVGAALLQRAVELKPTVRSFQDEIEAEQRIPQALVQELKSAGFYRMLVPSKLGGLQVDLLTFLRAVELMAEADASTGWNLANNAVQQVIALSLPDAGVDEILKSSANGPDVIIAGTAVAGGGTASRVEGGYKVTGRWRFGSGCRESQWMLANFDAGPEQIIRFFVPSTETTVIETWDMTGMRGTGSHDWSVVDQFVPDRRTIAERGRLLTNQWSRWPGTLYSMPVHTLIGPHHSSIATGIARSGIDALAELAGAKVPRGRSGLLREQPLVQDSVARAEAILSAGQALRRQVLRDIWETVEAGVPVAQEQLARSRIAASYAVDAARQAMDLVYRAGGTTSNQRMHQLARTWRDLQVVGQAASVAPE